MDPPAERKTRFIKTERTSMSKSREKYKILIELSLIPETISPFFALCYIKMQAFRRQKIHFKKGLHRRHGGETQTMNAIWNSMKISSFICRFDAVQRARRDRKRCV